MTFKSSTYAHGRITRTTSPLSIAAGAAGPGNSKGQPMTDDAWSNFIASINPAQLESERMRVHGDLDHERPGSRWDHEKRHAHEWLKQQRIRESVDEDMAGEIHRLQLADADAQIWHLRHTNPNNIDQDALDAALEAYRARKAAA